MRTSCTRAWPSPRLTFDRAGRDDRKKLRLLPLVLIDVAERREEGAAIEPDSEVWRSESVSVVSVAPVRSVTSRSSRS
jgi:hypothetical protein